MMNDPLRTELPFAARLRERRDATDRPLAELFRTELDQERVREAGKHAVYRSAAKYLGVLFDEGLLVSEIDTQTVIAFVNHLRALRTPAGHPYSNHYVRTIAATLRWVLSAGVRHGIISHNPFHDLPRGVMPPPTPSQEYIDAVLGGGKRRYLEEIKALTEDRLASTYDRTWSLVVPGTGMRVGEWSAVRFIDIDYCAQPLWRLTICRSWNTRTRRFTATKTGEVRSLPLGPEVMARLTRWYQSEYRAFWGRGPSPDSLIFGWFPAAGQHAGTERPPNRNRIAGVYDKAVARHGFKRSTLHDLRATFCTLLREAGADDRIVTKWTHRAIDRETNAVREKAYVRPDWRLTWDQECAEMMKLVFNIEGEPG